MSSYLIKRVELVGSTPITRAIEARVYKVIEDTSWPIQLLNLDRYYRPGLSEEQIAEAGVEPDLQQGFYAVMANKVTAEDGSSYTTLSRPLEIILPNGDDPEGDAWFRREQSVSIVEEEVGYTRWALERFDSQPTLF